jgi:hypothetical protein
MLSSWGFAKAQEVRSTSRLDNMGEIDDGGGGGGRN